jgi:hypothetical protein
MEIPNMVPPARTRKSKKGSASAVASTSASTETEVLRKPTVDEELEAARKVIADRDAKAKASALESVAPAQKAYDEAVASARKIVDEARVALNAAKLAAGIKAGSGKQGPRSDAAKSAITAGAAYTKLAGSPKAEAVIAVFGKQGYASFSWVTRATRMGMSTEDLCAMFVKDPQATKVAWDKVYSPKAK